MHNNTNMLEAQTLRLDALLNDAAPPSDENSVHTLLAGKKVVVYGCGDGLITLSTFVLEKFGIQPVAFLDQKFTAPGLIDGIPAMSVMAYDDAIAVRNECIAVISIGKPRYQAEAKKALEAQGFRQIILASDIYEYHLSHAPAGFEKIGPAYFSSRYQEIHQGFALLEDAKSRQVFLDILQTHITQTPISIPCDPIERQYFPTDVPLKKGVTRTINCGAYIGDTVQQLHRWHGKIEALICFEPELNNFSRLSAYLSENNGLLADSVMAFPCGVAATEAHLRFGGGKKINSSISPDGDTQIQCVALDHVISDFQPTFINMDIESAEPAALRGARQLIKDNHPDLAICVYHCPEHLWEIILLIKDMVPEYHFYMRNYTGFPAETVLYASV